MKVSGRQSQFVFIRTVTKCFGSVLQENVTSQVLGTRKVDDLKFIFCEEIKPPYESLMYVLLLKRIIKSLVICD